MRSSISSTSSSSSKRGSIVRSKSSSISSKRKSNSTSVKIRSSKSENTPPIDPNVQIDDSFSKNPNSARSDGHRVATPESTVQREVAGLDARSVSDISAVADPNVKVVARIRPGVQRENVWDRMVKKVSPDSLSVGDRKFTFDSVFDSNANQEDIFESVGIPLVKNALAGYNASILSYGQSGTGKTYTMWGPPSAIIEDPSPRSHQGIVPRIFQMLFSEIQKEEDKGEGRQVNYQCRCSFLEIYNGQIGDLLDPTQRNLEIKDDPKNGLYVENLTEEYVTSYDDVTQILIKGLSSRKVGATSINSKSSRSHIVFTCIIESWSKVASNCFSSSRTSRISLVDLAGTDRNKTDDANRISIKEGKGVKKSLAQLGYLVSILAKGTQSEKSEVVPYTGSCLTHLLRESLGGNAKLTVICAISPDKKNFGETLSTVRFGQRVKFIPNKPVINEITEDDVNDLSDQIRQLKEELIRAKSYTPKLEGNKNSNFQGINVRESLNKLRVSLNRSLMLPCLDNDSEEELDVNEDDVRELQKQLHKLRKSIEEPSGENENCETDTVSEDSEIPVEPSGDLDFKDDCEEAGKCLSSSDTTMVSDPESSRSITINSCRQNQTLEEPILSESPRIGNIKRNSMVSPSNLSMPKSSKLTSDASGEPLKPSELIRSSLQSSKVYSTPTESLAASLQRGLKIIDSHQRNSVRRRSSVSFSFGHLALKPSPEADEANATLQKLSEDGSPSSFICTSCRQRRFLSYSQDVQDSLKTLNANQRSDQVPNNDNDDLVEVIKRKEELEKLCMEQASKIEQLNQLVEQYKEEGKCSSHTARGQQNTSCPAGVDNETVIYGDDQPQITKEKCEVKNLQEDLNFENSKTFDMHEKGGLLKEIHSLRGKLQSHADATVNRSTEKLRSSLLSRSIQMRKSLVDLRDDNKEELERERQRWMEMESDWISLTDELRLDLESQRQHAEKVEMELRLEKQCTEELNDALQRSILGHAKFVEHYTELQEKYNDLVGRNRNMAEWIAELKKAVVKAGSKGRCSRFSKSLAAELSALRVERERERELLRKENKSLKVQLRDTAEAVHAAGELLVRLREAEHATSVVEENLGKVQEENDKLKKQMDKIKRKHKMEMITMKQYLAESRLPESALKPMYREDSDVIQNTSTLPDDDQAWKAEFGAIYQEHY